MSVDAELRALLLRHPLEETHVLGEPSWVQSPVRVFCRTCCDEMVFVAAMGSTSDLGTDLAITNESGFLYHFACNRCRAVSVLAQWS